MFHRSAFGPLQTTLRNLCNFGEAWSEIARLSPMVVALRADAALAALTDPLGAPPGEGVRMVAEKFDAAAQGAVAATLATSTALGRTLAGRVTPLDAALEVAQAAVAPARQKLRANVRRLGREHPDGRRSAAE